MKDKIGKSDPAWDPLFFGIKKRKTSKKAALLKPQTQSFTGLGKIYLRDPRKNNQINIFFDFMPNF
jgi:hypothetical protein